MQQHGWNHLEDLALFVLSVHGCKLYLKVVQLATLLCNQTNVEKCGSKTEPL